VIIEYANVCLSDENEASEQKGKRKCVGNALAAKHERGSRAPRQSLATFAGVREGHDPDSLLADKQELIKGSNQGNKEVASYAALKLAMTCSKADDVSAPQEPGANKLRPDDRTISERQLRAKVCEENRLTQFEYEFKIEGSMPKSANSRPIPFALRSQVREQIQEMLRDGILEESHSTY